MVDTKETGKDSTLNVAGETDVPITNVSYDVTKNVDTTHFNTGPYPDNVFTTMEYSGSFEHAGSNEELRQAIEDDTGVPLDPNNVNITVRESERTVIFRTCIVESRSKDVPGDGRTSETYDFVAEKMIKK